MKKNIASHSLAFLLGLLILSTYPLRPVIAENSTINQIETDTQFQKSLFLVQNEDALLTDRIAALNYLLATPSQESWETIFKTLTTRHKTQSAKKFHIHLRQTIENKPNAGLIDFILDKPLDHTLSNYEREIALTVLWNMARERAIPIAERLVVNISENQTIRSIALNHLMSVENSEKVLSIAKDIFHNSREETNVRLAALKCMEDRLSHEELEKEYLLIVNDPKETVLIKTNVILKIASWELPEFETTLLNILKNNRENIQIRRAALQALSVYYPSSGTLSLEIKKLIRIEKNQEFKLDLESVINNN